MKKRRQRGQIIPIFALFIFVLVGMTAMVVDVSWYWANTLRVQRAADAAALAGAVWLPGNPTSGKSASRAEATKNGYTAGNGVTVTPCQSSEVSTGCSGGGDARQMTVTITAPVPTYFMRVFGITSITARATSKAEYVQPLKMGSPLSDYGVYLDCKVSGSSIVCSGLPNPAGGGTLASEGFFGAIEGQGANRGTGDAFATAYNSDPALNNTANSGGLIVQQYDPAGYEYEVSVPTGGATLYVWDPTFCATTTGPGTGHLGTGDHWLSTTNHNPAVPVSTYFRLWWDKNGTPYTTSDDVLVKDSGSLFKNEFQVDKSGAYATASAAGGANNDYSDGTEPPLSGSGSAADCSSGAITDSTKGGYWHNKWWPMASGLAAGTYRLQVMTTDPANSALNANQAFENMWALDVVGSGGPAIYGRGRMVSYANIQAGAQQFYLAQIDQRAGAGKTIEIDLFDPGDVGDKAWLQILSPDNNVYTPVAFSYTADSYATAGHTSGTNVTCIQTYASNTAISPPSGGSPACTANATSGGQFYQNSWIQIFVPLPASYGSTGLTPPGEPAAGWWKIKYTVNKGNDTTTWMANIRGNPVHLVVP